MDREQYLEYLKEIANLKVHWPAGLPVEMVYLKDTPQHQALVEFFNDIPTSVEIIDRLQQTDYRGHDWYFNKHIFYCGETGQTIQLWNDEVKTDVTLPLHLFYQIALFFKFSSEVRR